MSIDIPIVANPTLIDRVLAEIQTGLKDNLAWLDYAFGRAQRITKKINTEVASRTFIFPACYKGENGYEDVSPDSNLGNFSFFQILEPQLLEEVQNQLGGIKVPFALIFWFDLRKVYPTSHNERNTEAVKAEILRALHLKIKPTSGTFRLNKIFERAENIYKEYPGVMEIENQFLMHPYAGFRFEGILKINEPC